MAEVLTPALAAEDVSGGSSLAVLFLVAVVLALFGWKLLEALIGLIFGLLGAIGMVLGALLVVIGVGAVLFEGARSVEAPAPSPPPAEPPVVTGIPVWVYVLGLAGLVVLVAVGVSLVLHVRRVERDELELAVELEALRRQAARSRPGDGPHPAVAAPASGPVPRRTSPAPRPAPEFSRGPEPARPGGGVRDGRRTQTVPRNGRAPRRGPRRRRRRGS
jgi:hypothetical protein